MTSSQLFCLLALFVSATIAGSAIHMTSSPATIKPLLTSQLTLKCELTKAKVTNNVHNTDLPHDCNVTVTSEDVDVINSIMITTEAGKEVASVTEKKQPRLLLDDDDGDADDNDDDDVVVTGELTGGAGGDTTGFLQVTWPHASDKLADTYICEINTLNKKGHGIGFKTALKIEATTPTISDMVSHIRNLEKQVSRIPALENQIEQCCQKHTETGTLECGPSSGWTAAGTHVVEGWPLSSAKTITQRFSKAYAKPPVVTLGVFMQDTDRTKNVRYVAGLVSVTETGFTMQCQTWTDSVTYRLGVSWISNDSS